MTIRVTVLADGVPVEYTQHPVSTTHDARREAADAVEAAISLSQGSLRHYTVVVTVLQ